MVSIEPNKTPADQPVCEQHVCNAMDDDAVESCLLGTRSWWPGEGSGRSEAHQSPLRR